MYNPFFSLKLPLILLFTFSFSYGQQIEDKEEYQLAPSIKKELFIHDKQNIYQIYPETFKAETILSLSPTIKHLLPTKKYLFVSQEKELLGQVIQIDKGLKKVVKTYSIGKSAHEISLIENNLFVVDKETKTISEISLLSYTIINKYESDPSARLICAIFPYKGNLIVHNLGGISILNPRQRTFIYYPFTFVPNNIFLARDHILITKGDSDELKEFDFHQRIITKTYKFPAHGKRFIAIGTNLFYPEFSAVKEFNFLNQAIKKICSVEELFFEDKYNLISYNSNKIIFSTCSRIYEIDLLQGTTTPLYRSKKSLNQPFFIGTIFPTIFFSNRNSTLIYYLDENKETKTIDLQVLLGGKIFTPFTVREASPFENLNKFKKFDSLRDIKII